MTERARSRVRKAMIRCSGHVWPLMLAACSGAPTFDDSSANEPSELIASSKPIDDHLNAGTQSAGSAVWRWVEKHSMAVLSMDGGSAIFAVRCDTATNTLILTRFAAAPHGGRATLSLTAPDTAASLPASAVEVRSAETSYWQAQQPIADLPAAVRRAFAASGSLRISVGGTPTLELAHSEVPVRAFRACEADD